MISVRDICVGALLSTSCSMALSQEAPLPSVDEGLPKAIMDTVVEALPSVEDIPRVDPFSLEAFATEEPELTIPELGFRPSDTRPEGLPELHLRGIGRMQGGDSPTALLDVEGAGLFVVNVDDTISLQNLPGENVLRVVEINDISVTVEAGSFGELIVVR